MSKQNIYDNEVFFENYKNLRESDVNYNDLLEQPNMEKLLPDVKDKAVLDLGCGYGINCMNFVTGGAARVVGVDISKKMLEVAGEKSADDKIKYLNMSMTDISGIEGGFDLVYSSLAFHYIEDFDKLCKDIYALLNVGGCLLFSQEHPIVTAAIDGKHYYNKDENGTKVSYTFSDYGKPGERKIFWYVDGVIKHHRRFSDVINALAHAGFVIDTVCEPKPDERAVEKLPEIAQKEDIKPTFLIVKAIKKF